ncbi:MAG: single-stranded DNA-binding protein [Actinomycetes bacterium]
MNDITLTVVGNLVTDVELRFTKSGEAVASFRVANTVRRFDRAQSRWVDGDTHYFSVSCWRNLASNVVQSLSKGMPVIITGKLRSREVERPCGDASHVVRYYDIEAIGVGPDLARGVATFTRVKREPVVESERRALADALAAAGLDGEQAVDLETGEVLEVPAA